MLNLKCAKCDERVDTCRDIIGHECPPDEELLLCARCSMPFGIDDEPIETMGGPLHTSCAATANLDTSPTVRTCPECDEPLYTSHGQPVGHECEPKTPRPSLSLLIVDFGSVCVVRVEKNDDLTKPLDIGR